MTALLFVVVVIGFGAVACATSSSTAGVPTTGIILRAESLTTGRGCGASPTQLYKYAVIVFGYKGGDPTDFRSYSEPVVGSTYDCFSDGTFVDLVAKNGSSTFRMEVYAFNKPAYSASRDTIDRAGASADPLRAASPTWTTECTATQQQQVLALAACSPLKPGLSGISELDIEAPTTELELPTTTFQLSNGRIATCGTLPSDGGTDVGDAGATEAGIEDASNADSGLDSGAAEHVVFTTARIRYRVGATTSEPVDVTCPTPFRAQVSTDPRQYFVDVGLLDSVGVVLGETTCSATVTGSPNAPSTAVCP